MPIIDPDRLAERFIEEWQNADNFITAHTSGSTGKPKEIRLFKSDMIRSAEATCRFFGIDGGSRLHLPLSTDYIAGKMMVVRALCSGAELIVEKPSSKPLARHYGPIDLTAVVPSQVPGLLDSAYAKDVRQVIVGGGQISPSMEKRLAESPIEAFATYGMTETCSHVALRRITGESDSFKAIDGITFSTDSRGCLVIDAPEFTFKRIITNDIVELSDSRCFKWLGRFDNVINSGGIKLHPELIESRLSAFIDVPFYIVGRPSTRWGEEAVMYVESSNFYSEWLIKKAHSVLDRYSVPKEVICVKEFIRTKSGKIKRLLL